MDSVYDALGVTWVTGVTWVKGVTRSTVGTRWIRYMMLQSMQGWSGNVWNKGKQGDQMGRGPIG